MKIGIIGLDTSHAVAFADILNDKNHAHHIPGYSVTDAFPGGSPDMKPSMERVEHYTKKLQQEHGVNILESPEAVADRVDAILLESVDGRVHLDQFRRVAPFGKPVFIDKPLAVGTEQARQIFQLAERYGVPVMSSSALRFDEAFRQGLRRVNGRLHGIDCFGPLPLEETQPGLFWYGIHTVEMIHTAMGPGCCAVAALVEDDEEVIVGRWMDGRLASLRGNRRGRSQFSAVLHDSRCSVLVEAGTAKPFYASLLEQIVRMFETGRTIVPCEETLAVIEFIEAANESRRTGQAVPLV